MGPTVLITGAAGFIGGTTLADFVSRTEGPIKAANLIATVRTEEQAQRLSTLGIKVIRLELSDEAAVTEAILGDEVDIVLHFASAMDPRPASHLIKALGERRKVSGNEMCFIHSAVTALFALENGWSFGEVRDTDPTILEKEMQLQNEQPSPVRETNIAVIQLAKEHGVKSMIVVVPLVYGRGGGEWRKLSSAIPSFVRASIEHKVVYKFDKEGSPAAAHVSDMSALYTLLLERILRKEPVPSGENGYYFAVAHRAPWWEVLQRLAKSLYGRGLVESPDVKVWPSDEMAAQYLGWPLPYARAMGTHSGELVAINAYQLGWQPKWDQERFLESIDDEVQAVQELDTVKSTIYDMLVPKD